ncbi:MAG: spermidine/putrescine ABC transporter substrate-binding protein [Clostridiales bacterium]|nr:spermidine/putrescine ABC transporter substrate-binding protein [Clostridiales bacterium]
MKKICFVLAMLLLLALPMTGCARDYSKEITVCNWGDYIDMETVKAFEKETGIKVNYVTVQSNEELYSKMKMGGVSYDVIFPSDYMVGRMVEEGMIQKLDFANIPNFDEYIDEGLRNPEYDPQNEYSVPYAWGTVGLIYNKTMVDEPVTSWSILWDEKYKGQILMFDNSRDAIGIALKKLGYSYNTTDETQLREALDELKKQKPLVQAWVMDQVFNKMESGEAAIAPYYTGDYFLMLENNEDLEVVIPEEGSNYYVDAMCVPSTARNKEGAELFIDYMTRPENIAKNVEYISYSSPSEEARDLMDPEVADRPICYPTTEEMKQYEVYLNLPYDTRMLYNELWVELFAN